MSEPAAVYLDATMLIEQLLGRVKGKPRPSSRALWTGSELIEVEMFRSVDAMRLAGELDDLETAAKHQELARIFAVMHLFPVSEEVIRKARSPFPIPVRALHALHAATAQLVQAEAGTLEFWTRDAAQSAAALTLGLEVRGISERSKH